MIERYFRRVGNESKECVYLSLCPRKQGRRGRQLGEGKKQTTPLLWDELHSNTYKNTLSDIFTSSLTLLLQQNYFFMKTFSRVF